MAEHQLPKLNMRVRFPSSAPTPQSPSATAPLSGEFFYFSNKLLIEQKSLPCQGEGDRRSRWRGARPKGARSPQANCGFRFLSSALLSHLHLNPIRLKSIRKVDIIHLVEADWSFPEEASVAGNNSPDVVNFLAVILDLG